jgi:hypothetical protein
MSGVEGAEREDFDDGEAGVGFGAAEKAVSPTESQRHRENL